ncbi:MAG TPA: pitrilysin family protein [Gemmatimonadaceae bacterium]|nr:pitrilysin family protein [Gemmatimonadaceae bacterium]
MRLFMTRHSALAATALFVATFSAGAQQPKREPPPALGTPKAFKLPPKREFTLANGMKVTFVPFGTIPKVSVYTMVGTGHIDEGSNEVALSDVTGEMMREGTATRTATQIAESVAGMGGELSVYVGDDRTQVGGAVLSERGPDMVRLEADLLRNPRFPESELARITANKAREVAIAKSQPQSLAQEQFVKTIYGDHPYGRLFPTDTMLKSYTIAQVRDFYARNFGAARAHLYVVGIFDAPAVERAVRESFESWAPGNPATVKPPTPRTGHSVTLLDRPNAVQSTIMVGLPVPGPAGKDYTALQVTDALLGGTFGSRVTTNIREQKGYTYSPYSYVSTHRRDAYWVQQADVTTKFTGASLKEIFGEINRLQKEAPGTPELDGIKNNMIGIFTLRNASRGGIVNQLAEADLQGLGDDYLSGYVKRVMAVSPAEVQRITTTYLKPEQMTLVVVGDKATVAEQLAPFQRPIP